MEHKELLKSPDLNGSDLSSVNDDIVFIDKSGVIPSEKVTIE